MQRMACSCEHRYVAAVSSDLAVFLVMDDAEHVPARSVTLTRGVGVFRCQRAKRLADDARKLRHRLVMHMPCVPVAVLRLAPVFSAVYSHHTEQSVVLHCVSVRRPDKDFAEAVKPELGRVYVNIY